MTLSYLFTVITIMADSVGATTDTNILRTFAKVGGIGGLALGVFLVLFRELVKRIFKPLPAKLAFKAITLFMWLTFSIAALGIITWAITLLVGTGPGSVGLVGSVRGWVVNGKDDSPIEKATVGIHTWPRSATTSVGGDFVIDGLPPRFLIGTKAEFYVDGWVIVSPVMDRSGEIILPDPNRESIRIRAVPRGDRALLSPGFLETPLGQVVYCFNSSDLAPDGQDPCPPKNTPPAKQWHAFLKKRAEEIGFTTEQLEDAVANAVGQWMHSNTAPYQQGLAALYRNDYELAGQQFKLAMLGARDDQQTVQFTVAAAYAQYRSHNNAAAVQLLDGVIKMHPREQLFTEAKAIAMTHNAPPRAPILDPRLFDDKRSRRASANRADSTHRYDTANHSCLAGDWKEDNPQYHWAFGWRGDTLHIQRSDSGASGDFNSLGNYYKGTLHWENGDTWKDVILIPNPDCSEVKTNQRWSYRR